MMATSVVAIPGLAAAKPYGYIGQGRSPGSIHDHAARISLQTTVFKQTVTDPVAQGTTSSPAQPALPAKSHR
jgi:hypothetical protein